MAISSLKRQGRRGFNNEIVHGTGRSDLIQHWLLKSFFHWSPVKPRVKTGITVKFGEIQFNLEEEQVKSCKNSTNKHSLGHLYPANYFVVYFKSLQNPTIQLSWFIKTRFDVFKSNANKNGLNKVSFWVPIGQVWRKFRYNTTNGTEIDWWIVPISSQ